MSSRLQKSSISPFRLRKNRAGSATKPGALPATPSARSSAPSSSLAARPTTPSSAGRPTTSSSAGRPTTASSTASSSAAVRGTTTSRITPVAVASSSLLHQSSEQTDFHKAKENVTVTVRFRPLSAREISKGDEIAWYADGDYTVRNEYNPSIAYGFDRVFGPATTTHHVYDIAAQLVVSGAMQGINGTVFAYGVTSSGKTHTMHGEQKSPGIIPLAVKDVFSIIQETPGREFLLRVSYLEIYNEVINDLLDPTGQNLRIREDSQGTYVEGIKEEVVLSPAHALSLIASGEGMQFRKTIESSPSGENGGDDDVRLSQLNLIDLAGSESSKTETTGLRRKEGSYINKSLLTLGTVISKLTDDKATHIPYRDSKLTRLLQSSLSGHGRVSLICTITPASSNTEETHNTLKFAHRSKHVEIKASQNKIMDEKSLIKKYQKEISCLKEELQKLKRGMMEKPSASDQDLVNLKLQLEAGQVALLSRLEEEEQAKAALMSRIQRLTKLILVSTKNSLSSNVTEKAGNRRRHSFGEDELAYLPDRKREYILEDAAISIESEFSGECRSHTSSLDEPIRLVTKNRRRGMLGWFKVKKPEYTHGLSPSADSESSACGSPLQVSQQKGIFPDMKDGRRKSISHKGDDVSLLVNSFPEKTQAGDLFSATAKGGRLPPTGTTIMDEMDLLGEQIKMLAGEVALCTSSLKRLTEQAANNPENSSIQEQMLKLKDEINEKKLQMHILEQRMIGSLDDASHTSNSAERSQTLSKLTIQLSEKAFELENVENAELQDTIKMLKQQVESLIDKEKDYNVLTKTDSSLVNDLEIVSLSKETSPRGSHPILITEVSRGGCSDSLLRSQVRMQAAEIENLKQENLRLTEEKEGLEIHCQKLAEEASYAKELASAAAVELRNLAEEVTKLSYQNSKLTDDLAAAQEALTGIRTPDKRPHFDEDADEHLKGSDDSILVHELQEELVTSFQKQASLESALSLRDQSEREVQKLIDEGKQREQALDNELASMWVVVAKHKGNGTVSEEILSDGFDERGRHPQTKGFSSTNGGSSIRFKGHSFSTGLFEDQITNNGELRSACEHERMLCKEVEGIICKLKVCVYPSHCTVSSLPRTNLVVD
ncbi:Kinesin-like protein NACK1 [Apostasia shenzhenica]|uniref:Kinesin-like protein NACK1 n=1 Tax=Apostasia shenzhenica TaxID=1088818 RepID=A0A2I0AG45_9ASPA|nr:Kinesin-like protein NACK1 [Apostasia shenzhenica]